MKYLKTIIERADSALNIKIKINKLILLTDFNSTSRFCYFRIGQIKNTILPESDVWIFKVRNKSNFHAFHKGDLRITLSYHVSKKIILRVPEDFTHIKSYVNIIREFNSLFFLQGITKVSTIVAHCECRVIRCFKSINRHSKINHWLIYLIRVIRVERTIHNMSCLLKKRHRKEITILTTLCWVEFPWRNKGKSRSL